MSKLPNHTALKEWASVIEALGRGEQVLLIRKGGLADPHFGLEADRFYLFPTNYHDAGGAAPARVPITHWAEVVRTWRVHDLETLLQLEPLVAFDRATIETRFRFRPDQAVNVIAVRVHRLPQRIDIAERDFYSGCRSWISIEDEIDVDGSTPVLAEPKLQAKIEEIGAILGERVAG